MPHLYRAALIDPTRTGHQINEMLQPASNTISLDFPNRSEFNDYYHQHHWALRAWLSGRVAAVEIDDISQEVWTKVAAEKYPGGNFRAWLFQVARRLVIDRYRSWASQLQRKSLSLSGPNPDGEPANIEIIDLVSQPNEDEAADLNQLRSCLDKLDPLKQQVVRGWLDNVKYNALGTELKLSESEVSNHFRTAKLQLRRCLEANS